MRDTSRACLILVVIFCLLTMKSCIAAPQGFGGAPNYAHAAVLRNAQLESRLSPHQRNPFYQDPRTARALARSSWLAEGETPVKSRDAEKIPRREIYNVLVHAGFLPRQRTSQDFTSLQHL